MSLSIRNHLLLILLPVTVIVWVVVALIIHNGIRHEVNELIDAQLVQSARVMLNLLSHEFYEEEAFRGRFYDQETRQIPQVEAAYDHLYEQKIAFQMWVMPHKMALRSQSAPSYPMSELTAGFSTRLLDGQWWRVYALADEERGMQVYVGESLERRNQLRDFIARRTMIPVMVSLPILALLIWAGVGSAVRPLRRIASEVAHREPNSLGRVDESRVPAEALVLVQSLNALFGRLQNAFENERRFTADAAHELRTPLAALKIQAQVAERAQDKETRMEAIRQVISGVDRAAHLAQQLLIMARLDPDTWENKGVQISLSELVSEVMAELGAAALAKEIDLSLSSDDGCRVKGDKDLIAILVRNLIDNAIKYTPMRGTVAVTVHCDQGRVRLVVADSGPGIPPEDHEKIFERFYRRLGTQAPGSGLGLSIVKRIADLHHAPVALSSSSYGGLQIEVSLPG